MDGEQVDQDDIGAVAVGVFKFARIPVSEWDKVDALGSKGWDLVTVSDGVAYLKRVHINLLESTVLTCGACANYSSRGSIRGAESGYCSKRETILSPSSPCCDEFEVSND